MRPVDAVKAIRRALLPLQTMSLDILVYRADTFFRRAQGVTMERKIKRDGIPLFQSNQLAEQRRDANLKKSRILRSEDDQTVQRTQELLDILEDGPDLLMTFNEALFSELVETITIQDNSTIRFRLINGLELPEHIERKK